MNTKESTVPNWLYFLAVQRNTNICMRIFFLELFFDIYITYLVLLLFLVVLLDGYLKMLVPIFGVTYVPEVTDVDSQLSLVYIEF